MFLYMGGCVKIARFVGTCFCSLTADSMFHDQSGDKTNPLHLPRHGLTCDGLLYYSLT